jgi:hypothetical protein
MTNIKPQFLPLTTQEIFELSEKIRSKKPLMTGLNFARQPFRVKALSLESKNVIIAQLQNNSDFDAVLDEVTFNFNLNDNKYFFQGLIKPVGGKSLDVRIELTTELHWVHRRAQERLIIPNDFYGALRITQVNSKLAKSFSRILNISTSGCSLEFKTETDLKTKDVIQGELSFITRPQPLYVDCEIVHRQESRDDEGRMVIIIGLRYIFKKSQEEEAMKELMIDLFRDIFASTKKAS